MKIVIYGATEIGCLIATEFFEDHDITIIDKEENRAEELSSLDISFIHGNASNIEILKNADIKNADVFIACSNTDEANIVAAWTAKKISNTIQTVAFVTKKEYFKNFQTNNNAYFEEMGIDYILWSQELLVQEIYRIITVPEAIDVEYLEGGKARLFEYRIKEDTPILNKELKDCSFPEGVVIVGITRDNELFIPNGSSKLRHFLWERKMR